jgi:hypothetical protein
LRIQFTITYADGTAAEATASVADQVAFEQAHDRSIARLADDFRLTDACWLAWHSLKRTGKTGSDFDAWLESVDNVEIGESKIVPLEGTTTPTGS